MLMMAMLMLAGAAPFYSNAQEAQVQALVVPAPAFGGRKQRQDRAGMGKKREEKKRKEKARREPKSSRGGKWEAKQKQSKAKQSKRRNGKELPRY
ncbi:hypothetical protein V8C35DRAFT_290146 [Trichoderma chlorosporum]